MLTQHKQTIQRLAPLLSLLLFAIALWVLHRELKGYRYHDVVQSLHQIPLGRMGMAFGLTLLGYFILTGYDTLAFRYIRHPLSYGKIAFASFIGYAFSNTLGHALITGGSIRFRLYSSWGLSAIEIAKVVAFCILTFWIGFAVLGAGILLFEPAGAVSILHLPPSAAQFLGTLFLLCAAAYLISGFLKKEPFRIRGLELPLPSPGISFSQLAVSSADWAVAGSIFYILLPSSDGISFTAFFGIYLLAQFAGVLSQVPGGIGVFETVIVLSLSPVLPATSIIGSLLLFRAIYYVLPLGVAVLLLGMHEIFERMSQFRGMARFLGQWAPEIIPHILALSTFVAGVVLLFSGATPSLADRLLILKEFLPLPVMELSHFLGSIAGMLLLLLARGLQRRLLSSYYLSVALLTTGILLSVFKGFDYEEAAILLVMLTVLLPSRSHFYRKDRFAGEPFTPGWIAAILLVLLGSAWLGAFSYKHVEYSHELWWQFSFSGDAPRFLRATVGAAIVVLVFGFAKLLRAAPPEPALPSLSDVERAHAVIRRSPRASSHLALSGDKDLLFNEKGTSFLMYGIQGRSWVSMGDPVGPREEMRELTWQFHELCDRHGGWTVFYQVEKESLSLYVDLGLTLLKLGEEARVALETFSLEGGSHKGLRYTLHRLEKEGCTFEVVPLPEVPSFLPECERISRLWLSEKNQREKGFSLGFFQEDYLKRVPLAIVRQRGEIIAFANLWPGAQKEELSLDLMRYLPQSPQGVMEYLLIQLLLWGKQEGYRWFNLGMAPLSGLEIRTLSPLWNRIGTFAYHHGEHFYHFQGLRQFKEKFSPHWEPRYLASPGGLALPNILTDIIALISTTAEKEGRGDSPE